MKDRLPHVWTVGRGDQDELGRLCRDILEQEGRREGHGQPQHAARASGSLQPACRRRGASSATHRPRLVSPGRVHRRRLKHERNRPKVKMQPGWRSDQSVFFFVIWTPPCAVLRRDRDAARWAYVPYAPIACIALSDSGRAMRRDAARCATRIGARCRIAMRNPRALTMLSTMKHRTRCKPRCATRRFRRGHRGVVGVATTPRSRYRGSM